MMRRNPRKELEKQMRREYGDDTSSDVVGLVCDLSKSAVDGSRSMSRAQKREVKDLIDVAGMFIQLAIRVVGAVVLLLFFAAVTFLITVLK